MDKAGLIGAVLGAAGLVVSCVTASMYAAGTNPRLIELESSLAGVKETVSQTGHIVSDTYNRVTELDVGLTAVARSANIDPEVLSRAIAVEKERVRKLGIGEEATGIHEEDSKEVKAAVAEAPKDSEVVTPAVDEPSIPSASSLVQEQAKADEPSSSAGAVEEAKADEAPQPLSIKLKPEPVTVAMVDSILATRISESWVKPAGNIEKLSVSIEIAMGRSGNVADVNVLESSGDAKFDSSALTAIRSIARIEEISRLREEDYLAAYAKRAILFTPDMGK